MKTKRVNYGFLTIGVLSIVIGSIVIWSGYAKYLQPRFSRLDLSKDEIIEILGEKGFNLSLIENLSVCKIDQTYGCIRYIPYGEKTENLKIQMGGVSSLREKWRGENEKFVVYPVREPPDGEYQDVSTILDLVQGNPLIRIDGTSQSGKWNFARFTIEDDEKFTPVYIKVDLPEFDEKHVYQLFVGEGHMKVIYPEIVAGGWNNSEEEKTSFSYFYIIEPEDVPLVSRFRPIQVPWWQVVTGIAIIVIGTLMIYAAYND
jgi:hypothetical protein